MHIYLAVRGQLEPRRLAGVLVLKELSQNTRAVIFTHVTSLFDKIWAALRDKDSKIRVRTRHLLILYFSPK
jgi:hypothetical protein